MAELLVRTVDAAHADPAKDRWCYKRGDAVLVMPDGHGWGRMESKPVWVAEGRDPVDWPGGFYVVRLPDLNVGAAAAYVAEDADRRRAWTLDLADLERRSTDSGRDTLNLDGEITRNFSEVSGSLTLKV